LIVDSASEVLKIPAEEIEPPPAVFQEGGLNCVTGLGKCKGRLIVLLDMNKLLAYSGLAGANRDGKASAKPEAKGAAAAR
jgi:purine-binding chemotaxis protein CheW